MAGKFALAVSSVVLACACQAVFGDFAVEPAPPAKPPPVLGAACEPETYRCADAVLERCGDDRRGFVPVETCASAAECNLNAKTCRPCTAGEFMCRGAALESCVDGIWVKQADCPTAALCSVVPNLSSGSCVTATCDIVGAHACLDVAEEAIGQGPTLVRCPDARDHWEVVELCENGNLCDAYHADELVASGLPARCLEAECAAGAFRCEAGMFQVCAPDRTGWLDRGPCESAEGCSATRGTCGTCTAGEIECNGAELRSCTETGVWETLDVCDSAALCDVEAEQCQKAECAEPGALRCTRTVLERCSDDLVWEDFQACATEALCNVPAGRCLAPACAADETRCRGAAFERCSADRTHFTLVASCAAGETCDAMDGCAPGSCMDGTRCNGSSLERCAGGRVEFVQQCATASLCDAAVGCDPPLCGPGPEFQCEGRITRRCRPGRDAFEEFFTCAPGTTCDAPLGAGRNECDVCTPDAYECTPEGALLRCSSDGQALERVQSCAGGCTIGADGTPVCN